MAVAVSVETTRRPVDGAGGHLAGAGVGGADQLGRDVHAVVGDHVVGGEHLQGAHGDALADRHGADVGAGPVLDVLEDAGGLAGEAEADVLAEAEVPEVVRRSAACRAAGRS